MHGAAWIGLIRRLPADLHDSLIVTTSAQTEVVIQSIFRIERDYMVLLGRLAGTQDTGRVVMMPYDQICNIAVAKRLPEAEIQRIFGQPQADVSLPAGEAESPPKPAEAPLPQTAAPVAEVAAAPQPVAEPTPEPKPRTVPSKSILLARLRARLAEKEPHGPADVQRPAN